eukprot:5659822-Prorocentrum_lima.AAC.1
MASPVAPVGLFWFWCGLRACLSTARFSSFHCPWFSFQHKMRNTIPAPRLVRVDLFRGDGR